MSRTQDCVMSHIWIYVWHECVSCICVTWKRQSCHVTRIASCHALQHSATQSFCVTRLTHIHMSCRTYENSVMSHICICVETCVMYCVTYGWKHIVWCIVWHHNTGELQCVAVNCSALYCVTCVMSHNMLSVVCVDSVVFMCVMSHMWISRLVTHIHVCQSCSYVWCHTYEYSDLSRIWIQRLVTHMNMFQSCDAEGLHCTVLQGVTWRYFHMCDMTRLTHLNMWQSCDAEGSLNVHAPSHPSVLQCITVSVLQCAAACCGVLRCVAVCCSVLLCAAVCCSVLQYIAMCCSVLHARLLGWKYSFQKKSNRGGYGQ